MPKLSVIIAVYNVEEYLPRCIESILAQEYKDFELLLINDGSTDKCGEVCKEYALKDNRIIVVDKKNGGLSDARNEGIKLARGKYLSFIDSDDFILPHAYNLLIDTAEKNNLDIVCGYSYKYLSEKNYYLETKKRTFEDKVYNGIDFLCMSIDDEAMPMCAPFNIYKKELIDSNKLLFKKGIFHEDELWTPQVFLNAKRVKHLDIIFYVHCQRFGSITESSNKYKNAIDIINTCYELENIYKIIENKKYKNILNNYLLTLYLNGVYVGKLVDNSLVKKSFVFSKAKTIKNVLKSIIFLINIRLYCKINSLIKDINKSKIISI